MNIKSVTRTSITTIALVLTITCAAGAIPVGTVEIKHTGFGASGLLRVWGGGLYGSYVRGGIYTLDKTGSTGEGDLWHDGPLGSFCIENCVEKVTYWPAQAGAPSQPVVTSSGITDFNESFPRRINAFLEDVTNEVPRANLRASGRDALATLEYTWAAMQSYEQGGILVRPHPLPPP